MNIIKQWLTAVFLLLSLSTIAQLSSSKKKIEADRAWSELQLGNYGSDFYSTQKAFLKYRQEGLKFWKMFPDDVRKYDWSLNTVGNLGCYLYYWKIEEGDSSFKSILKHDIYPAQNSYSWPVDKRNLVAWESIYPSLRKEFIEYYDKNPKTNTKGNSFPCNQLQLVVGELKSFLSLSLNKEYRLDGKTNLQKLSELFISTGIYLKNEKLEKPSKKQKDVFGPMGYAFLDLYKELGLTVADIRVFFNGIKSTPYPILREWAIMKENLFLLTQEPLSFKHKTIDGRLIDLKQLRGKVVLIDFWSTNCSSCIANMPAIKVVYDSYKNQGFEVISACLANDNELNKIKVIEDKIGADWPILLIGRTSNDNSLGQHIWRKYGFWGVPQLLLLNKQGKLVMLNDKLKSGDFEPIIKGLLTEKYNSNR